jgi:hypothetical protein
MATVVVLGSTLLALAFDLTGTWEGRQVCRTFNGDVVRTETDPSTLRVTQSGASVNLEVDGTTLYHGEAVPAAGNADRGRAGFIRCGTTDALAGDDEMGRVKVATRANGLGKVRGFAVVRSAGGGIGTCTWRYDRTGTADPGIGPCP